MKTRFEPSLFTRHNRPLHTLWLDAQAWFCAHELGRMAGRFYDKRCICKLDPDQHRVVQLFRYGQFSETTMISELVPTRCSRITIFLRIEAFVIGSRTR